MNSLKAGFARVDVTPMMGIEIAGYYKVRRAEGVLDNLEINALAISCGDKTVVILNIDNLGVKKVITDEIRSFVAEKTGLTKEAVFFSATHTHTAPYIRPQPADSSEKEYRQFVTERAADAAMFAINDLKPAKMGFGIGQAPHVAFVRRFKMKDGSIKTNPGVNNPDISEPVGAVDESVNVVRFDRDGAETIVLVNFANHPDVVGGNKISGDWPHFVRMTVEKAIDNTKCIFLNGAQGDVNHVNVHPTGGDMNGMFVDFDDVSRGYSHAKHIGQVVAGGVLQVYEKVKYTDVDSLRFIERPIRIASNRANAEELVQAKKINELHNAGKDSELPYEGMMLTTVVAEAARMVRLENGPDYFDMTLTGIAFGPIVLIGIPGEPFTGIGTALKNTDGFDMILPCCAVNGFEGYFPMRDAYDEGGYESRSSSFKAGVAEYIIEEGKKLISEIERER